MGAPLPCRPLGSPLSSQHKEGHEERLDCADHELCVALMGSLKASLFFF